MLVIVETQLCRSANICGVITPDGIGVIGGDLLHFIIDISLAADIQHALATGGKGRITGNGFQCPVACLAAFVYRVEIVIVYYAVGTVFHNFKEDIVDPYLCVAPGDHKAHSGIGCAVHRLRPGDYLGPFASLCTAVQIHHSALHGLIVAVIHINTGSVGSVKLDIHANGSRR